MIVRNFEFVLVDILDLKILPVALLALQVESGGAKVEMVVGLAVRPDEVFSDRL